MEIAAVVLCVLGLLVMVVFGYVALREKTSAWPPSGADRPLEPWERPPGV